MKCPACSKSTKPGSITHKVTIGGHDFVGSVAADVCPGCDEAYTAIGAMSDFELAVSTRLADSGMVTGEAFRFMRKSLGLGAKDIGAKLGVPAETISRWETGERPPDRFAWLVLGDLVRDAIEGKGDTEARLQALREPPKLAKTVRMDVPRAARG